MLFSKKIQNTGKAKYGLALPEMILLLSAACIVKIN